MNAYFRLVVTKMNTMLELIPATDDGEPLDINEIVSYLHMKQIDDYNPKALHEAVQNLDKESLKVPVSRQPIHPVHETCVLYVSEDKMTATARFYPPSDAGNKIERLEILSDLGHNRITFGIDKEAISEYLADRQYCTDIVVARGKEPRHGEDAWIEYFFNTDLKSKPARKEDGSVDFFNLNTINHCKKGDLLARLHPEDRGTAGSNVHGEKIKPRDVKRKSLKFGRNITLSEDGKEIYSNVNGHVILTEGKVFVSDVYEVEDVGTATGNIVSQGSVLVNGNVQSGFSVQADGNVEVRGVVEGASVIAGGDIIIIRGMNGMGKGTLKAGGKIITKFVENATVDAGDYVEADTIMHSVVHAKTQITVDGRKGFIAGGMVRATERISCRTLGSAMGSVTVVEVGVNPEQKERYVELQKEVQQLRKKAAAIKTTISGASAKLKAGQQLTVEQSKYIQSLMAQVKQVDEKLVADSAELEQLEHFMGAKDEACVRVRDTAYAGTRIAIGDDSITLKESAKYCRFKNIGAEIRIAAY